MKSIRKVLIGTTVTMAVAASLVMAPGAAFAATQSFGSYNCGTNNVLTRMTSTGTFHKHSHRNPSNETRSQEYYPIGGGSNTFQYVSGFKSIGSAVVESNGSISSARRGCDT